MVPAEKIELPTFGLQSHGTEPTPEFFQVLALLADLIRGRQWAPGCHQVRDSSETP